MTTSAGRVVLTFDVDDKGVVQGLGRVKGEVDKSTTSISTKAVAMGTAIGTAAGKLAVDALKYLGREFKEIATRGVELAPVVTSFNNLTASIGLSGDAMLGLTRSATKGLISDLDIMASANKAMQLGIPVTAQGFADMAHMATVLGRAMKQDATKSLDDLIVALGRSSPMILDNLGLSVKVGEANEAYALAVGKTSAALTDAEKKLAFHNAALQSGREAADALGGITLTLADRIRIAQNWVTNFTDSLGVAVATSPVINTAFDQIGQAIGAAVGENQTNRVQMLIAIVNDLAIRGVTVAQVLVDGAGLIVRAWSALQLIFGAVMTALFAVSETGNKAFLSIVEGANKVPGIRGQFDDLAASLRDGTAQIEGMRQSFQQQTAEAWEGVKGNSAMGQTLGALSERLDTMKTAMIAAGQAQADTDEIARQLVGTQQDQVASTEASTKAAKALEDAVEKERQALSALGITTERDVNLQIREFQQVMARAAAEGVPIKNAMALIIPKLIELRAKALASGTAVDGLDSFLQGLKQTVRDLNGPIPTLNAQLIQVMPRMDQLAGKTRVVTSEMLRQQTEARLLGDAYETLSIDTQASLDRAADAARIAYQRITDSGRATERELKEARAAVEQAEIDAGQRTVSLWQTQIQPAIEGAWQNITGSLSANFTDMLTGAVGFKDGFVNIWNDLKSIVTNLLSSMLQTFLNEFLGGMMQGLTGWAAKAGRIIGGIMSGGGGASVIGTGSGIGGIGTGAGVGGGAGAGGVGVGAGLATAGLGVLAGGAAYTLGKMATEWTQAFFGEHFTDQSILDRQAAIDAAVYTGAASRAGMTPEEFVDAGLEASFARGGEVFAGSGMPATVHGHEAIFPLPDGFDLASSLQALDGVNHGGGGGVIHLDVDGVRFWNVMLPKMRTSLERFRLA